MDWLDDTIERLAAERNLELDQHTWGDDDRPKSDGYGVALRVKGFRDSRTVTYFDASILEDCGSGDPGQRGYAEELIRQTLDRMAQVANATTPQTRRN